MIADVVANIVAESLDPGRFLTTPGSRIKLMGPCEQTLAWEFFRGHLLDESLTRRAESFLGWKLFASVVDPAETMPVISVLVSRDGRQLHVVRHIRVYGHEAYVDAFGVIQSRPVQKWQRECVGTIDLLRVHSPPLLRAHLQRALFRAVAGQRLPIISLESPLPAFNLGQLAYRFAATDGQDEELTAAKEVEFFLRSLPEEAAAASADDTLLRIGGPLASPRLFNRILRVLFHHVALSPYTGFVQRLAAFLKRAAVHPGGPGPAVVVDVLSYFLRHLVRHLTAYDLVNFHNRGANYPDALALDEFLRALVALLEAHPELAEGAAEGRARLCRRALRQAWLARKLCEGLPVPAHPTSPGENLRVLPPPFSPVSDEELTQPQRRTRQLFAGQPAEAFLLPTARRLLIQAVGELSADDELRELGTAVYLDRPLGIFKLPGEVDRTPLLSYQAFSAKVARQRLERLRAERLLKADEAASLGKRLEAADFATGVPAACLPGQCRPGVVALEDALQASPDFVFQRTTRSSLDFLLAGYRFQEVLSEESWDLLKYGRVLLIRTPRQRPDAEAAASLLTVFDEGMHPRCSLAPVRHGERKVGYLEWDGIEYLAEGLCLLGTKETVIPCRFPSSTVRG